MKTIATIPNNGSCKDENMSTKDIFAGEENINKIKAETRCGCTGYVVISISVDDKDALLLL